METKRLIETETDFLRTPGSSSGGTAYTAAHRRVWACRTQRRICPCSPCRNRTSNQPCLPALACRIPGKIFRWPPLHRQDISSLLPAQAGGFRRQRRTCLHSPPVRSCMSSRPAPPVQAAVPEPERQPVAGPPSGTNSGHSFHRRRPPCSFP